MIVGRDAELQALRELIEGVSPVVVLVSGEAGIGKTALINAAVIASAVPTIQIRCHEEITKPFATLTDIVRTARARKPPSVSSAVDDASGDRGRLLDFVEAAVLEAPDSVELLVIEDLHWAAPDTLDLLPQLEERLSAHGIRLIGSYRSHALPRTHRMRWVRTELRRTGRLHEVALGPLSREDSDRLTGQLTDAPPAVLETIYEHSRGVPFYLRELARAVHDTDASAIAKGALPVPETVRDAISVRLSALEPCVREQLVLAAALGNDADTATLEALGADPDVLLESGFVELRGEAVRFRHSIVRDAVRAETGWRRRRAVHRVIAGYLESVGAHPRRLAEHWGLAGDRDTARARFYDAAVSYHAAGAHRDAANAAREALHLWPAKGLEEQRVHLLQLLATSEHLAGEIRAAAESIRELSDHPIVIHDPARRADVNRRLAAVMSLLGDERAAVQARRVATAAFREAGRSSEVAAELLKQLPSLAGYHRFLEAADLALEAAMLAERDRRVDLQARAMGLRGHLLAMAGQPREGRTTAEAAFSLAVRHELSAISAEAYRRLGGVLEYSSEFAGAADIYESAIAQCRLAGAEEAACDAMGCMCYVLYRTGDWSRSMRVAREVLTADASPSVSRATALTNIAMIRTMRGETRGALTAVDRAAEYAASRGYDIYALLLRIPRAALFHVRGFIKEALAEYRSLLRDGADSVDRHDVLPGLCHAAGLFAEHGAVDELVSMLDYVSRITDEAGNPEAIATLHHVHGALAEARDRLEDALPRYLEATRRFEEVGTPLEQAHALGRAGWVASRLGRDGESGRHLDRARSIARRIGARHYLGVGPGGEGHAAAGSTAVARVERADRIKAVLSPRQLEVATLLMDGLANKEMAARLFLSTRTVEMHVAHICDRLNCRSRTEAVTRLAEMGMSPTAGTAPIP